MKLIDIVSEKETKGAALSEYERWLVLSKFTDKWFKKKQRKMMTKVKMAIELTHQR